jgi:hypothetical protein
MSKVANCGFGGAYHIDFLGMPFRVSLPQFADDNSRKINGQIFKTALSTLSARPGRLSRALAVSSIAMAVGMTQRGRKRICAASTNCCQRVIESTRLKTLSS